MHQVLHSAVQSGVCHEWALPQQDHDDDDDDDDDDDARTHGSGFSVMRRVAERGSHASSLLYLGMQIGAMLTIPDKFAFVKEGNTGV